MMTSEESRSAPDEPGSPAPQPRIPAPRGRLPERDGVLERIAAFIARRPAELPRRIAVDGIDAAGKTTFANALVPYLVRHGLRVFRASGDDFHRPAAARAAAPGSPGEGYYRGAFDLPAIRSRLIEPLGDAGSRKIIRGAHDLRSDRPFDPPPEPFPVGGVLLVDGVFLLRPELRDGWDVSIFLRVPFEESLRRAEFRDAAEFPDRESLRERYRTRYHAGQRLYLAEAKPERHATFVVENSDATAPTIVGGTAARETS